MDFRQMEAFVNVVKYKSFSKAADALFLTQPTISIHINTLEKELGVMLILRNSKEASLTREGKIFYKYALNMLNTREKAIFSMHGTAHQVEGILEIQTSSIPGEYILPEILNPFAKAFPLVRFYIEQSDSSTVLKNLSENKGEIGFTGIKGDSALSYDSLIKDEVVLITPINDKFKELEGQPLRISDFIGEPFILREQGSATRKEFEEKFEKLGFDFKKLNTIARMNSMEAIKQAVGCGLGVSIVSKISAHPLKDRGKFIMFRLDGFDSVREFYLVHSKEVPLTPRAEAFISFVKEYYNQASLVIDKVSLG